MRCGRLGTCCCSCRPRVRALPRVLLRGSATSRHVFRTPWSGARRRRAGRGRTRRRGTRGSSPTESGSSGASTCGWPTTCCDWHPVRRRRRVDRLVDVEDDRGPAEGVRLVDRRLERAPAVGIGAGAIADVEVGVVAGVGHREGRDRRLAGREARPHEQGERDGGADGPNGSSHDGLPPRREPAAPADSGRYRVASWRVGPDYPSSLNTRSAFSRRNFGHTSSRNGTSGSSAKMRPRSMPMGK